MIPFRLLSLIRSAVWASAIVLAGGLTVAVQAQSNQPASDKDANPQPAQQPQQTSGQGHQGHQHEGPTPFQAPGQPNVVPQTKVQDVPAPTVVLKEGEVPGVKFDTPTYQFGRIRSGEDVVHDFWFTNTGTGPLEILKVKPACGCTQAGAHDKIVQPGETGKIPIKMSTGRASGPLHKTVMVNTNAPGEGAAITLHIQGEVWQPIQATPASASFGRLTVESAQSTSLERKLTIVNNTEQKIILGEITCSNPAFKATSSVLEEGKKFELTVSIVPPIKSTGPVTGTVDIVTGLSEAPKLQIPVNAYVTADVDVTPNQLTVQANRTGNLQRQFFIRNNTVNPVKISDAAASNEALKVSVVETQPVGKAYRLTVDIPENYQIADGGDKISFKTDNPNVPEISIPISQAPNMADVQQQFQGAKATVKPGRPGVVPGPVTPQTPPKPSNSGTE